MKLLTVVLICVCCMVSGCGEEFVAGTATGAALMAKAQDDFVASVETLNEVTVANNAVVAGLIKPETIEAVESLRGREKDPATWIALISLLANGVWAGRAIEKRKGS